MLKTNLTTFDNHLYQVITHMAETFMAIKILSSSQLFLTQPEPKVLLPVSMGRYCNRGGGRTHMVFDSLAVSTLANLYLDLKDVYEVVAIKDFSKMHDLVKITIGHLAKTRQLLSTIEDYKKETVLRHTQINEAITTLSSLNTLMDDADKNIFTADSLVLAKCLHVMMVSLSAIDLCTVQSGAKANENDSQCIHVISDLMQGFTKLEGALAEVDEESDGCIRFISSVSDDKPMGDEVKKLLILSSAPKSKNVFIDSLDNSITHLYLEAWQSIKASNQNYAQAS